MAKKKDGYDIDKTLNDLYTAAEKDFEKKLLVAREMVKLEVARLRQDITPETPEFFKEGGG